MSRGGKKIHNVIDLGSDESVRDTIARATAGHQSAAWFLIHQLEAALRDRRVSDPLFDHAADFFGELLDINDSKDGRATPRDLVKAFDKLHIVHRRGQPTRDKDEALMLAAYVVLLREAGFSTDKALGALEALGEYPRSSYRAAHGEWGEQLERLSVTQELEAMVGEPRKTLLRRLEAAGGITRAELRCAMSVASSARVEAEGRRV